MTKDKSRSLKVLPVPVPPIDHPEAPYPQLMKHEFTLGLIAPKGCGKTTVICNMLAFYRVMNYLLRNIFIQYLYSVPQFKVTKNGIGINDLMKG